MLKIKKIERITEIEYKAKSYPIIEASVCIDDEDASTIECFASEDLAEALCPGPDCVPTDRDAYEADREIYAYVPRDLHTKDETAIIEWLEKEID